MHLPAATIWWCPAWQGVVAWSLFLAPPSDAAISKDNTPGRRDRFASDGGGCPRDELRLHHDPPESIARARLDPIEHHVGRPPAQLVPRPADRGQGHAEQVAMGDVARPDDGDVVGEEPPPVPGPLHC